MTPDPRCWACQPMYEEWQAVLVAIVLGVEIAAYVVLVAATAFLCLHGALAALRRIWT